MYAQKCKFAPRSLSMIADSRPSSVFSSVYLFALIKYNTNYNNNNTGSPGSNLLI